LVRNHTTEFAIRRNTLNGEIKFDVAPGDYYFSLCGGGRNCSIRQIVNGDAPLATNNVHLPTGSADPTFTITFAIGTHTLKGVAQRDGKPAPGVFLLIFPA